MRVLVTGGNGFIGSHVVDNLQAAGFEVTVLDRAGERGLFPNMSVRTFLGDIRNPESVHEAVIHNDGVIHLAAILGTQETITHPSFSVDVNIHGSLNVFEACRLYGCPAVYVGVGNHWMNNTYSISKTCAERFAFMYNKERGAKIAVVRGLNVYGPGQKYKPVRKMIPNFILPALKGEEITVYGDGTQVMDLLYVTDFAEILKRALIMDHGNYSAVMEAGMGENITVNEIVDLVLKLIESKSGVKHVGMRPGEEPNSTVVADPSTLSPLKFSVSDMVPIQEGLTRTIEYYAKQMDEF